MRLLRARCLTSGALHANVTQPNATGWMKAKDWTKDNEMNDLGLAQ